MFRHFSIPVLSLAPSLLAQVSLFNLSQFHLFKWLIPIVLSLCSKSCSPLWYCSAHFKVLAHSVPISTVPKPNEKYLSLFKLKPTRGRCHREDRWDRLTSISLSSQTEPAWLVPGSPCVVVKALLALDWAW